MALSIAELAELAGTSRTSVSLTLNGKAKGKISRATQETILRLMAQHGCRPDTAARWLRSRKGNTIGTVMPSPHNAFYAQQVAEIQINLAARGYTALFSFWETEADIPQAFESVFSHGVDGIIAYDFHPCMIRENIPAILFALAPNSVLDVAMSDERETIRLAVASLKELGHRRIAFCGNFSGGSYEAFRICMSQENLELRPQWQRHALGYMVSGAEAMRQILAAGDMPTAVICHNDEVAVGVISALDDAGLKSPDDMSIIGSGNMPLAEYCRPSLTTFECHYQAIAVHMVERLLQRLQHPELPPETRCFQPELIVRKSTGAVAKAE